MPLHQPHGLRPDDHFAAHQRVRVLPVFVQVVRHPIAETLKFTGILAFHGMCQLMHGNVCVCIFAGILAHLNGVGLAVPASVHLLPAVAFDPVNHLDLYARLGKLLVDRLHQLQLRVPPRFFFPRHGDNLHRLHPLSRRVGRHSCFLRQGVLGLLAVVYGLLHIHSCPRPVVHRHVSLSVFFRRSLARVVVFQHAADAGRAHPMYAFRCQQVVPLVAKGHVAGPHVAAVLGTQIDRPVLHPAHRVLTVDLHILAHASAFVLGLPGPFPLRFGRLLRVRNILFIII